MGRSARVNLTGLITAANLSGQSTGAILTGADLSEANLEGAILNDAIMPDGTRYVKEKEAN
jgi:uncharacterized protein YjbI with pentapeptide repeats